MKDQTTLTPTVPFPARRISEQKSLEIMIESAVERSNNKVLGEMRAMNRNLERAVTRLIESHEGVAKGEKEFAVASVVEGEHDDLPRLARVKADPSLSFTLKTGAIAKKVGLSTMRVSFLLNKSGLNWTGRKPELWSMKLRELSNTRFWRPETANLLKAVLDDPNHRERKHASKACKAFFKEYDA